MYHSMPKQVLQRKTSGTAEIPARPEVLLIYDIRINILLASIFTTDRFPTIKDLSDTDFNRLSTSTESVIAHWAGLHINGLLLVINSKLSTNSAYLQDIRLRNLSDLDFDR